MSLDQVLPNTFPLSMRQEPPRRLPRRNPGQSLRAQSGHWSCHRGNPVTKASHCQASHLSDNPMGQLLSHFTGAKLELEQLSGLPRSTPDTQHCFITTQACFQRWRPGPSERPARPRLRGGGSVQAVGQQEAHVLSAQGLGAVFGRGHTWQDRKSQKEEGSGTHATL